VLYDAGQERVKEEGDITGKRIKREANTANENE
jgi:hypothetical protein